MNYWKIAVEESLEEVGAYDLLNEKQISALTELMKDAHEMYHEYSSYGHIGPDPNLEEIEKLKKELMRERNKSTCRACNGYGSIRSSGPSHYSDHDCDICRGKGRI